MAETCVALLRGVNVGKASRVAMADLRGLAASLGYTGVRTLLNSGNIVFDASEGECGEAGARLEAAMAETLGVSSRVVVLTAGELASVVAGNPLLERADDPSRLLVAFLASSAARDSLGTLEARDWSPEALAVGERAAYLWCPDGVVASPVAQAVGRAAGDAVTTRAWGTVLKLHELAARG